MNTMIKNHLLLCFGVMTSLLSCNQSSETKISDNQTSDHQRDFSPIEEDVHRALQAYFPEFSDGLELNPNVESMIGRGYKFILADLNGDTLTDAIVDYSLLPNAEMNGGGGNAIGEISGLIYFENSGEQLIVRDHTQEFPGNFGSRNELQKIENGIIFLKKYEYTEEDGRCCPSIPYLTELKIIEGKCTLKEKPYPISE